MTGCTAEAAAFLAAGPSKRMHGLAAPPAASFASPPVASAVAPCQASCFKKLLQEVPCHRPPAYANTRIAASSADPACSALVSVARPIA